MFKDAKVIVDMNDVLKAKKMDTEFTELKVRISNAVIYSNSNAVYVKKSDIDKIIRDYALYAKSNNLIDSWFCNIDTSEIVFFDEGYDE